VLGDRLFVLNAGGNSVAGFSGTGSGQLVPIAGSVQALPGGGPAEVAFSRDGRNLLVTERDSNTINTVPVASDGRTGSAVVTDSSCAVPFGFAVDKRGDLNVSEAGGSPAGIRADIVYGPARDCQS